MDKQAVAAWTGRGDKTSGQLGALQGGSVTRHPKQNLQKI